MSTLISQGSQGCDESRSACACIRSWPHPVCQPVSVGDPRRQPRLQSLAIEILRNSVEVFSDFDRRRGFSLIFETYDAFVHLKNIVKRDVAEKPNSSVLLK